MRKPPVGKLLSVLLLGLGTMAPTTQGCPSPPANLCGCTATFLKTDPGNGRPGYQLTTTAACSMPSQVEIWIDSAYDQGDHTDYYELAHCNSSTCTVFDDPSIWLPTFYESDLKITNASCPGYADGWVALYN